MAKKSAFSLRFLRFFAIFAKSKKIHKYKIFGHFYGGTLLIYGEIMGRSWAIMGRSWADHGRCWVLKKKFLKIKTFFKKIVLFFGKNVFRTVDVRKALDPTRGCQIKAEQLNPDPLQCYRIVPSTLDRRFFVISHAYIFEIFKKIKIKN